MHAQRVPGKLLTAVAAAWGLAIPMIAGAADEWLSLGAKQWAPTVTSKSGIGTANAMAEAKVTRKEIEGWCANWSPGDKGCVQRELSNPDARITYRASADCTRGRITPVDGSTYTLAGTWDNSDIGGGRTRWRDASGKIVGRDNASGGLAISQQWEVLCPGGLKPAPTAKADAGTAKGAAGAPAAQFTAGQRVEAKYGSEWVRGRVDQVRQIAGANGPEFAYDVRLDNGKRGVVPARMLRPLAGN